MLIIRTRDGRLKGMLTGVYRWGQGRFAVPPQQGVV
jgi:hypothetical protein